MGKIGNALNNLAMTLKKVTFESTLKTLSACPQGRNLYPFLSKTSHFRDTRLSKIGKMGKKRKRNGLEIYDV